MSTRPDLSDPALKDIWAMGPREARLYASQAFGEQKPIFRVRGDMMHNAIPFRTRRMRGVAVLREIT